MNTFGISEKSYSLLVEAFLKYPEVEEVIVFGSRAKGDFKMGSDIDLAIKGKKCTAATAWAIGSHLNENAPLPYYVDVVCYNNLGHDPLKEHIDRIGKNLLA